MTLNIGRAPGANGFASPSAGGAAAFQLKDCCAKVLQTKAADGKTLAEHIGGALAGSKVSMHWGNEQQRHGVFMKQTVAGGLKTLWALVQEHAKNHTLPDHTDSPAFWSQLIARKAKQGATGSNTAAASHSANPALAAHRGQSGFG